MGIEVTADVLAQAMMLGFTGFLVLDRMGLRAEPDAGAGPVGLVLMCGAIATLLAHLGDALLADGRVGRVLTVSRGGPETPAPSPVVTTSAMAPMVQ